MTRAAIRPELLNWALERAGIDPLDLEKRFPKLPRWQSGDVQPTLKQLDNFARAVPVPVGYLFLAEPPQEPLPIPDFRTLAGHAVTRPSPNLLDMIYACQERQSWYRDFARVYNQPELEFIGSVSLKTPPETAAERMCDVLGFDLAARRDCSTWNDALRLFIRQADQAGVLVMVSGIVGSNTHRKLNVEEFRGFALSDKLAPVIFINGADTKAAQMFTLAHELAHLWLGSTAISNIGMAFASGFRTEEVWCNKVAAELLVPLSVVRQELRDDEDLDQTLSRLARQFKVSTLVVLRRLLDAGQLGRADFEVAWGKENSRLKELKGRQSGGGDFYKTTPSRVSRRLAKAIVISTLEGQTLYRDAFRMLGISKTKTFNNLGREVGVME